MNRKKRSLLIVDDEPYILPPLLTLLSPYYDAQTVSTADEAEQVFQKRSIDIILTDQQMPHRTGVQLLEWVREHSPKTVRLLMTGYAELEEAVAAINRGQVYYYLLKPWRTDALLGMLRNAAEKFELERSQDELLNQLQQLNRELEERVAQRTQELEKANRELQQSAEEMKRLALTDPLTGLLNRRAMDGLAVAEMKRHGRYHNSVAMGLIDADFFGQINKVHLQTGGDVVLIELTKILTATMRDSDSVGRVGGEEFLVIARETGEDGALMLGERICERVRGNTIEYQGKSIKITVSVGFAVAEGETPATYPQMYELASVALKKAKDGGRNQPQVLRMTEPIA